MKTILFFRVVSAHKISITNQWPSLVNVKESVYIAISEGDNDASGTITYPRYIDMLKQVLEANLNVRENFQDWKMWFLQDGARALTGGQPMENFRKIFP